MTKIKMCGLRRREDIEYVNKLLPDYIGYVFAEKSKRYISPVKATELTELLDERIIPVGVFVNETIENIASAVKSGAIKVAQLHGNESEEEIMALKSKGIPVIKAFRISCRADCERAERSCADFVLLDSGGGSGETFDWSLISGIKRKFFLAGGITPENVGEAIEKLAPYAVDASSCLETDGFKDFEKMKAFAEAVGKV
ncbi:MAG: phosphoribosylanthranilate isomerase [Ruminococcus sp.]|uniref:phosphoribosylanthranilate isomerase n=1 Tax=Ruminococcus sp. TaxID=41978 RepID=UPI0025D2C6CA|nr:phosphoribosylanthranilate isomerase [Ruminococcus sp.]MBR5682753.1 phosphoribosylanthranilate isomerase [Ruminococcus sp.]